MKYSKITNTYDGRFLNCIQQDGKYKNLDWVVTEKIHGANFRIFIDYGQISFGSRNQLLRTQQDLENFYGIGKSPIFMQYLYSIGESLWKYSRKRRWISPKFVIYGELFGGTYPGEFGKVSAIQTGVYYSPDHHFFAFDIAVENTRTDNPSNELYYIDQYIFEEICRECGISYLHQLFKGTLEECLEYPNNKETTLPSYFGLLPVEDNIMEGVVIKPVVSYYLKNSRVILKNKNEKFSGKQKKPKTLKLVLEELQESFEIASQYINNNRLDSAISKVGGLEQRTIGPILGEMCRDTVEVFTKENLQVYEVLGKNLQRTLKRYISSECRKLIFERLTNSVTEDCEELVG